MRRPRQFITVGLVFALLSGLIILPSIRGTKAQNKSQASTTQDTIELPAPSLDSIRQTKGSSSIDDSDLSRQIESLVQEKESRTKAQQKLDSQLIYAAKQERGEPITDAVPTLALDVKVDTRGYTLVDIRTEVNDNVRSAIKRLGGQIVSSFAGDKAVRANLPIDALEAVAGLDEVKFIRPAETPYLEKMGAQGKPISDAVVTLPGEVSPAAPVAAKPSVANTVDYSLLRGLRPGFNERAETVSEKLLTALAARAAIAAAAPGGDDESATDIGEATAESDTTHRTREARNFFGLNGKGLKIGILSDSFNATGGYARDVQTGDLPGTGNPFGYTTPVTIVQDNGTTDEGRAMAQIVHDIVPGAQLFFATANGGQANFANNIRTLRNTHGCDIIVDDVGYFLESPLHKSAIVSKAVDDVVAAGAMYFASAGNAGNLNDGTSGVWEGNFVDAGANKGGILATVAGGTWHDFDPSAGVATQDPVNRTTADNRAANLFWSDPLGASTNDYDLYLISGTLDTGGAGQVVTASTNVQNGTQDPAEQLTVPGSASGAPGGRRIAIFKKTAAAVRFLHVTLNRSRFDPVNGGNIPAWETAGQANGHDATGNCYSTAATPAAGSGGTNPAGPFPGTHSSTNQVESFSSDGPRRIFYDYNNAPITPADLTATGGTVLQKPQITAADGVQTTVPGFQPFFGTSAAAPTAAAIAALVKASNTSLTPAQIDTALTSTAIDIEAPGVDRDSGVGIVNPYPALVSLSTPPGATVEVGTVTTTVTSGCDASFSPGESGQLTVQLNNLGGAGATGVVATVTSLTPGVTVTQSTSPYPDIPSSGSATNSRPFTFTVSNSLLCGGIIRFSITVNFTGGQASPISFPVTAQLAGTPGASAATTSYTGAPVTIPDNSAAGVNIPVTVSGFTGAVSDINFRFGGTSCNATEGSTTNGVNHPFVGDVIFKLISPSGRTVTIISQAGGASNSGNNFCNTVLDDDTANGSIQSVTAAQNPYTGTFKPANPLSAFDGEDPNGTWILNASDVGATDVGNVTAFSLDITPFVCPAAPTSTITGRITDASNNGIDAVTVKLSGTESQTTSTNANGDYTFNLATCGGTYTVTPSKPGYTFSPPERTFVNLSGNQTANFTGSTGITPSTLSPGQVVISEFRVRGLAGALDEFVEIANKTGSPITVGSSDATTAGWTLAALDTSGTSSTTIYTIPNGTVIPAYGHFLIANGGGYSLNSYATADAYFTGDIPDNTGLALFTTGNNAGPTFDAVGFNTAPPGFADLYREGGGTTPVGTTNGQYSLYRTLPTGLPQDTNNNANDFEFVSTNAGTYGSRVSKLGAPGPENLNSPTVHTGIIPGYQIDTTKASTVAPNRVRDLAPYIDSLTPTTVGGTYTLGTLSFRRRYVNATGAPVKQLRFRLIDYTSFPAAPGMADLRALTSPTISVTTDDAATCAPAAAPCVVVVQGLTLEQPPTQPMGGGLNATLSAGTITLATPLAYGSSINVHFLHGVRQSGSYRFFFTVDALQ